MYQTAYLKANYPAQYMAALLTSEAGNHDKLARYIAAARDKGMEILPPEINSSARDFRVVPEGIRFGFAGIKNIGEGAIESILESREQEGPFHSVFEFARRIDSKRVNKRVVEALVKSGAFDSLHPERARAWEAIETAMNLGASAQRDREMGQVSLFGGDALTQVRDPELPDVPPWTDQERLGYEKEALGFFVSGHPLDDFVGLMHRFSNVTSISTEGLDGRDVRAAGVLKNLREIRSKRGGELMAFAEFEDLDGSFELVVFPATYAQHASLLKRANERSASDPLPLLVMGKLEQGEPSKILVRDAIALEDAEGKLSTQLRLRVQASELTKDRVEGLRNTLAAHPGDCEVRMHVLIPGESETILALSDSLPIRPSEELLHAVNNLFGRRVAEYGV